MSGYHSAHLLRQIPVVLVRRPGHEVEAAILAARPHLPENNTGQARCETRSCMFAIKEQVTQPLSHAIADLSRPSGCLCQVHTLHASTHALHPPLLRCCIQSMPLTEAGQGCTLARQHSRAMLSTPVCYSSVLLLCATHLSVVMMSSVFSARCCSPGPSFCEGGGHVLLLKVSLHPKDNCREACKSCGLRDQLK